MRRTMIALCLLLSFSCTENSDSGGNDTGPVAHDQQAQVQDSAVPDTSQHDAGPDLPGRAGGADNSCIADQGGDSEPPLTCEYMGWECLTPDEDSDDGCPVGLHPTDFGDCEDGTVCCATNEYCFKEGEIFDADFGIGNCCPGLVEVGNAHGSGNPCSGQTKHRWICTACGDGICGPFENPCNCQDCPTKPDPTCQDINYTCAAKCGEGTYVVDSPGCTEGQFCCSVVGCLPAGQVVMEAYHERCCDGLQEIQATTSGEDGDCESAPDANPFCAACPDGICDGGWENACNCPEDCNEL